MSGNSLLVAKLPLAASALVERGDTSVALRVDLDNTAARALYAAEGFTTR